jgi:hypothetical protein
METGCVGKINSNIRLLKIRERNDLDKDIFWKTIRIKSIFHPPAPGTTDFGALQQPSTLVICCCEDGVVFGRSVGRSLLLNASTLGF